MSNNIVRVFNECGSVQRSKFINLIAHKLKEIDPDAFNECVSLCSPRLTNMELLPIVIDEVLAVYPYTLNNHPTVLSCIFLLYSPWKIVQHDNKLPAGMRDLIAKGLNIPFPEMVSQHSQNLDVYWKNPRFKAKVMELADKIYNDLNEAGFLEENAWKKN